MLGIHGLHASISLLMEVGMNVVERAIEERVDFLVDYCGKHDDLQIITPIEPHRRAGIFTFRHKDLAPTMLHELLKEAGVVCAVRGGGIRFSPHFYTPVEALERALKVIPTH
jgi:selenocysteine lyase/cysteine desulfurase